MKHRLNACFCLFLSPQTLAAEDSYTQCLIEQLKQGNDAMTLLEVRQFCSSENDREKMNEQIIARIEPEQLKVPEKAGLGIISERIFDESQTEYGPYVITPRKVNYILPAYTTSDINKEAYRTFNGYEENLEDVEAKFQLSLKVPLNQESLLIDGDKLYFGYISQT